MSLARRAVIDVGTNSVKVLVADVDGRRVLPVLEDSKQTRLGRGFYETQRLQAEPISKTVKAVSFFADTARALNAAPIRVVATSAAREAVNREELVSAIEAACGLKVEVISGDQEAEWAFRGAGTDPEIATRPVWLLDVGGGSTEFILGVGEQMRFAASFPLGTVRLLEKIPHGNPPRPEELAACRDWARNFLSREVRPRVETALQLEPGLDPSSAPVRLVGAGGAASILARMEAGMDDFDRERIEAVRLSLERVRWHGQRLWNLPLAERQQVAGLPKKRADVILTGLVIYEAVMEQFGFQELRVSTRGLRYAVVMEDPGARGVSAASRR